MKLIDVNDIADQCKVGKSTVYKRIICKPDFPKCIRIGRRRRWVQAEVDKWILKRRAA